MNTKVVEACKQYAELNNKWIVLPLHSTLSLAEQEKVFDYPPDGIRNAIIFIIQLFLRRCLLSIIMVGPNVY